MKKTKSYLKARWEYELKSLNTLVVNALVSQTDLTKLNLPKTDEGLVDLRGFSAPKKIKTEKSNSGRGRTYISESIRIKNKIFENIDFSYADFECCELFNCHFKKCLLKEARFVDSSFWGCMFDSLILLRTNFGQSTFKTDGLIFKKFKENFQNIVFDRVNFSQAHFLDQRVRSCQFLDCKTGFLTIDRCLLENVKFAGLVKNLFIKESRKVENLDFTDSRVSGLNLTKQPLTGFLFPQGDAYFKFKNKIEQLHNLKIFNSLTAEDIKTIEVIKAVWLRNNLETDFVDINWLKEEEIELGKLIIKALKNAQ